MKDFLIDYENNKKTIITHLDLIKMGYHKKLTINQVKNIILKTYKNVRRIMIPINDYDFKIIYLNEN